MNKALEDLQAGRDPFAAQEEESSGELFYGMALWSMWLSIMTGVLCECGTNLMKNLSLDPKTGHIFWLSWLIGSYVLFAASVIMGIIALFGIGKHGADGILTRALRGVLISGTFLALLITGTVKGIENRQAMASVQAAGDELRTELRNDLDRKDSVGFTNYQRQAQKMKNALDDASAKMSGNDALIFKAGSATMAKMQLVMSEYSAAATPIMQPAFISMEGVVQPQQLQGKKEMVAQFMSANEKLLAFVNNLGNTFTAEMTALHVPSDVQAPALKGFQANISAQNNALVKIREQDRAMGKALMGIFNLLDANWGRWKFNPETKKVGFMDDQTIAKYNAFLKDLVTAGQEQQALQRQYLTAQNKGG